MKVQETVPVRAFATGRNGVMIRDCGRIRLVADEQVTFQTDDGTEYDVVRKSWGYYATPSTNSRLAGFGLRAVLARSVEGRLYVLLVQAGREAEFRAYCLSEGLSALLWLDGLPEHSKDLDRLLGLGDAPVDEACVCGSSTLELIHEFRQPPSVEIRFELAKGETYFRRLLRCRACRHVLSKHELDDSKLYQGDYVTSNYGAEGLKRTFDKINALDPKRSDNVGRVNTVAAFTKNWFEEKGRGASFSPSVLDIGSGLCVFLHRLKDEQGWKCTALDPDARACKHAEENVGVRVIQGDLMKVTPEPAFDLVTLNKVIEHSHFPIQMLTRARGFLSKGGLVYVEVPDAEGALDEGPDREEFTIDHPHAFSATSLSLCLDRAGFRLASMQRLREPSGKFTLRAFAGRE